MARQTRRELLLPSFGAHITCAPERLQEQNIYPLAVRADDGFDLDFSSLLLLDGLVIDTFACDYIRDAARPQFTKMCETVHILQDEGYCRLVNFSQVAIDHRDILNARVSELLESPELWLSIARTHWKVYKKEIPHLIARMPSNVDRRIEELHFGVFCHLANSGDTIDFQEAARLTKLLESKKKRLLSAEVEALREIIRPILSHVMFSELLRVKLGLPFIDWDDLRPFYARIQTAQFSEIVDPTNDTGSISVPRQLGALNQILDIAIPELRPGSVRETLDFIKNKKATKSLRAQIQKGLAGDIQFDQKWAVDLRNAANSAQISSRGRQRIVSLIGALLGAIPIHGLGAIVQVVQELGHDAVIEAVGSQFENVSLKDFEWYFALVRIASNEKRKS